MALQAILSPVLTTSTRFFPESYKKATNRNGFSRIRCISTNVVETNDLKTTKQSGNNPSIFWDYNLLQSLSTNYTEEKNGKQIEQLKNEVKSLINREMEPLAKLELIESIQRLGLKYLFEMEIKNALNTIYLNPNPHNDLYSVALHFRLFRQNGYDVTPDVFERFKDGSGEFKASIGEDVKGILSMYEACFFGYEGEKILDEAMAFSTKCLMDLKTTTSGLLARKIEHALDMPLHWRLNRMEARWFIDTYEQEKYMYPTLLQLAKLDFNMLQSIHQKEVAKLARWWMDLGLNNYKFARDRLAEHYSWSCGIFCEPQYGAFRDMATKVMCLITTIDDVYDVYGSLEELELLTDFIERWDITRIDELPDAIQAIFLAMYNTTNEIGYWTIKEKGFNIIPYLSKEWAKLCKAYLTEAQWYHKGYKPTLDEYLENSVVSGCGPLILFCSYFLTANEITTEALEFIDKLPTIMHSSSKILRLANDLDTSSHELARGDMKSVQCYMNEKGVSEEEGRKYINELIYTTWKVMNKTMFENANYPFSEPFVSANPNMARTFQFFYHYGDGHANIGGETMPRLSPILLHPIPL